jgi:PPM family protein phosphatase
MTDEPASEALSESSPPRDPAAPVAPTTPDDGKVRATPARPEIKLRLFGRTDVGQVREHNEDNFIVADLTKATRNIIETDRTPELGDRGALLGVCDGMGGAAAGEVASQLAVDIIFQKMTSGDAPKNHDEFAARLVQSIEAAGLRIFSEAKMDRTRRGMGTTSTIAALMDDHLFVGQVGDSRAYILRGERLVQVTRDQSLVNQLIEAGQLTEEEAETFEHNNIILQALGTADSVQVDLTFVPLRKGDTLLLCSDGLSGMIRNDEIREVLRTVEDPVEACKVLIDRANQAGGHDNVTVVVSKFEGAALKEPAQGDVEALRYTKYDLPELPAIESIPSPNRRVKDLDEAKISVRSFNPAAMQQSSAMGDVDTSRDGAGRSNGAAADAARDGDDLPSPRFSNAIMEDPIDIPTEGAPTWLVIMMIASAVACVTIALWYLVH